MMIVNLDHSQIKKIVLTDPNAETKLIIDMLSEVILPNQITKEFKGEIDGVNSYHKSFINSSRVSPACRIIPLNVPLTFP